MPQDGVEVKVEVLVDGATYETGARLSGRFEPIDGRYHWSGRLAPCAGLAELGRRQVSLRVVGGGDPVPARLAEIDPWGGVRVTGVGPPPGSAGTPGSS